MSDAHLGKYLAIVQFKFGWHYRDAYMPWNRWGAATSLNKNLGNKLWACEVVKTPTQTCAEWLVALQDLYCQQTLKQQ